MPASPILGLNIITPGNEVNTWGNTLNTQLFPLLEQKAAGVSTIALSGNYTLTNTNFAPADTKQAVLVFTSSGLTGGATVTVPTTQNVWLILNNTGQIITFSNGAGSTVQVPVGRRVWLISTGSILALFDAVADVAASSYAPRLIQTYSPTATDTDIPLPSGYGGFKLRFKALVTGGDTTQQATTMLLTGANAVGSAKTMLPAIAAGFGINGEVDILGPDATNGAKGLRGGLVGSSSTFTGIQVENGGVGVLTSIRLSRVGGFTSGTVQLFGNP